MANCTIDYELEQITDVISDKKILGVNNLVTPWEVSGRIDYMKLVNNFGTQLITEELKERFEKVTKHKLHPWIKRNLFFSHRELNKFLDAYEKGEPIFLYTGRGPTSQALHLGHMIPFTLTRWLQKVFDCPLVIQIADDEKYYFKNLNFDNVYKLGFENAKDIISIGFDPEKTFIFSNRDYRLNVPEFEVFVSTMKKMVSAKEVAKVFGFGKKVNVINDNGQIDEEFVFDETSVGMMDWPFYQTAAAFSKAYPHIFGDRVAHCMVVYAIDQDNYFRLGRNIASEMNLLKPYSIMSIFLDPLTGSDGKMSSSTLQDETIFLTDDPETIKRKIFTHAFSGGGGDGTLKDHQKYGGNPDIDIPCKFLKYFEYDDDELERIYSEFKKGVLSCFDTKKIMADTIIKIILKHQEKRSQVTDDIVKQYYDFKSMKLPKPLVKDLTEQEKQVYDIFDKLNIKYSTMYHDPIRTVDESQDIIKKINGIVCKNLLLNGEKYYMYVTNINTEINMKSISKKLGEKKIRFTDRTKLCEILNVEPSCATIFSLINENSKKINVVMDDTIQKSLVNFHPMRNDATTTISYDDLLKFLNYIGYTPLFIQH